MCSVLAQNFVDRRQFEDVDDSVVDHEPAEVAAHLIDDLGRVQGAEGVVLFASEVINERLDLRDKLLLVLGIVEDGVGGGEPRDGRAAREYKCLPEVDPASMIVPAEIPTTGCQ